MARARKIIESRITITVDEIKFILQKDKKKGFAKIEYEKRIVNPETGQVESREMIVKVPIVSIWIDDISNNAVKAFMKIVSGNSQNEAFKKDLRLVNYAGCPDAMMITCDGQGNIFYGPRVGSEFTSGYYTDSDGYISYSIYSSKVIVIKELLNIAKRFKTIGGTDTIDFSRVNRKAITQLGFEEIPDWFERGISMWRGNVNTPFDASEGYSYSQGRISRQDNIDSFLDMLNKSVRSYKKRK